MITNGEHRFMDTKNLTFTELVPATRREPVSTIRLNRNRISLGALAYADLKQPSSVKLEVDTQNHVIRLTPEGPFSVGKTRAISSNSLAGMPEGLYEPMGDGLYKWAVKED